MKTLSNIICLLCFLGLFQVSIANPTDPCQAGTNQIENGDFSNFDLLNVNRELTDFIPGAVDDWAGSHGYANIEGLNDPYAELSLAPILGTQDVIGAGIFQSINFETGKVYRIKVKVASNQVVGGELNIALANGLTTGSAEVQPSFTSAQTIYTGLSESFAAYPNAPWTQLDLHFVAEANFNQLWIQLSPLSDANVFVYIDDICLGEVECGAAAPLHFIYQVSCANAGTEMEISIPAAAPALHLYETDGSCDANNLNSDCMIFPPFAASPGGAYTFTVPNNTNYILEWRDPQGCPQRDLITPPSTKEIDISHLKGDICDVDAFIEIPFGIQYYNINIYEIDPNTNESTLACNISDTYPPYPDLINVLQQCPDVTCDNWKVYRFDLSYYDDCGEFHTESVKSRIFCTPNLQVVANPDPICAGEAVTYSLTYPNNGISQWYVNGVAEGNGGPFFTTTIGVNDVVSILHFSPQGCISGLITNFDVDSCPPPCQADFAALGLQNQFWFADQSSAISPDYVVGWHWDFGDGGE